MIGAIFAAADAAGIGIAVSAIEGEALENLWVSDAVCVIVGRPREDLLRASSYMAIAPEEVPRMRELRARRQRGEAVDPRVETVLMKPDGTRVPVAVAVTYVEIEGRRMAISLFEDISKRTKATAELADSEARFRALVEAAPDGIAILREQRIVYANPCLVRQMGYEHSSEMVGRSFAEFIDDPAILAIARARNAQIIAGQLLSPIEYRFRRRDAGYLVAEVTTFTGHWDGVPSQIAFARDISERVALEAQLARADRLAALGTLSAGVAHEINNPLTFLTLGLAALEPILREAKLDDARMERATVLFEEIRRGADRVATIVRDLRAFSRFEEDERAQIDLTEVLASAQRIAAHEVRARGKFTVSSERLPAVVGSAGKLEQVFVNLLINAAQALPETGGSIEMDARSLGETVVIEVRDDGPGIPPELVGRVFDPFFTTKPPGVGTGLGLSISHAIVNRMGGSISIVPRSESHRVGTIVRVTLPTSEVRIEPAPSARESRRSRRRARVLVIDDEPALALTLRCVLEADHDVVTVGEGKAALVLLEQGDFDLVLCDLAMPGISGDAVYERVAAARPELAGRFVFMTGGAFTARLQSFLDRVPNPRLQKPFPISALEDLLASVTESRR